MYSHKTSLTVLAFLFCSVFVHVAYAATPVVNTAISVHKTGSEPFDATTWDGSDLATAGFDEDEDNVVVRLQDSITYQVEVSVNDSDVGELAATVTLDKKQAWIEIPTGCKSDISNPSSISADKRVLFCNTGSAIEGTTKVFYPTARAIGASHDGTETTLNDDRVGADVTAQADGISNVATDTSEDTTVTANFRINTNKELKSTATDPNTGESLYVAPARDGAAPDFREGSVMEYIVKAQYIKGSMIADSDEISFEVDYQIIDIYTDDNDNNNGVLSTGGVLYDWNPAVPGCNLIGDHGPNAAISCTQLNAAIDDIGAGGAIPDGIDDPNIQVDLTDIDVRDPDNDANLFEFQINIWFDRIDDIETHQVCAGGGLCVSTVTNRIGVQDGSSVEGFNPVSTEDAGGSNLANYNGPGEPFPNEVSYPLEYIGIGSWAGHIAFTDLFPYASDKYPDQYMAAGETRPFLMNVYDYRKIDGAQSQLCNKLDTQVFDYAGIAPPFQTPTPKLYPWNHGAEYNPGFQTFLGAIGGRYGDGESLVDFYFTNTPYAADPIADQAGYLTELRTAECNDDVNGDGSIVIVDASGALVDENGNATTGAIDWWVDASMVKPLGGGSGDLSNVTRIRQDMFYDADLANAQDPTHAKFGIAVNHLITAKNLTSSPYGSGGRLPHFMSYRRDEANEVFEAWMHASSTYEDPLADANFSISVSFADRMTLVPSSHAVAKRTDPQGIKVVRGGDTVDFIVEPEVVGLWDNSINTATISDNLPFGTSYVNGSEAFSTDGGATWIDRATYDASAPAVTITSTQHIEGDDPLIWEFGSVDAGEQLPLIKYSVFIDPERVSGTFANTATMISDIGADQDGDGNADDVEAEYQLTVLPEFGFDVLKLNTQDLHEVNASFTFDLIYKNLGGEDYSGGEFIDIFPYNDDGGGIISSGLGSTRIPSSRFTGKLILTDITATNSEVFYVTDADPATIPIDPCHSDNQPSAFVPLAGDLCYRQYIDNGNQFTDGATAGQGMVVWAACTSADPTTCSITPEDITALRFSTPTIPTTAGGQTVTLEFTPVGNVGGDPDIDTYSNVTSASTGDIYTNTFGGRIPEVSLVVISNDVSVTVISGSLSDYVWFDDNQDGTPDPGEEPLPGVTLVLFDGTGNSIYHDPSTGAIVSSAYPGAVQYSVATDEDGLYRFDNLPSGDYEVRVDTNTLPENLTQTYDYDGAGDHASAYTLQQVTDNYGVVIDVEDNDTQDFGYYAPPASIGDTIYNDTNANNTQDPGEEGIEGLTVTLTHPDGSTQTTTTDANGNYLFDNLLPGAYTVTVTPPEDYTQTQDPDNTKDHTSTYTLEAGEHNKEQDFGYVQYGSLGNYIWIDTNKDGIKDSSEEGLPNITVTLTDREGNQQTTVTDAQGKYLFENLLPGEYTVTFQQPANYEVTYDYDGNKDTTSTYTLGAGENTLTQNFGLVPEEEPTTPEPPNCTMGSIGNHIFLDVNADGKEQKEKEPGIPDITVKLTYVGPDNIWDTDDDITHKETTGNKNNSYQGKYQFDNLPPGRYRIELDKDDIKDYIQTYDPTGATINRRASLTLGCNEEAHFLDFGFTQENEEVLAQTGPLL